MLGIRRLNRLATAEQTIQAIVIQEENASVAVGTIRGPRSHGPLHLFPLCSGAFTEENYVSRKALSRALDGGGQEWGAHRGGLDLQREHFVWEEPYWDFGPG